jgi:hypothetical protein
MDANGAVIGTLGPNRTVVGLNGQVLGTLGGNGTVVAPNGTLVGVDPTRIGFNRSLGSLGPEGNNVFAFGGGVIVPGFDSFSNLSAGLVSPQTALGLGLSTGAVITPLSPMGGPAVASATGVPNPGRSAITSGNFTPGTIAPGVSTVNPNAPGSPVFNGPFTPGTIAPGVSQQTGTAPPAAAGATTSSITHSTPAALQGPAAPGTTNVPPPASSAQTVGRGSATTGQRTAPTGATGGSTGQMTAQPGAAQPAASRPTTGQPTTGQPVAGQPAAGQPAGQSTGAKPGGAPAGGGTPR